MAGRPSKKSETRFKKEAETASAALSIIAEFAVDIISIEEEAVLFASVARNAVGRRAGDVVAIKGKSQGLQVVVDCIGNKTEVRKFPWLEMDASKMTGKFMEYPERENIPEKINEQLIVELYSK